MPRGADPRLPFPAMDAMTAASQSAEAWSGIPSRFMMDGTTYERGAALGFEGIDFYFAGRGGVLGDVPGGVVAAAMVFFNPSTVVAAWDRSQGVCARAEAAAAFAACAEAWAGTHLPDGVDYLRLAELQGKVIAAANPAGAPLFAGWVQLPEPASAQALALHRMNALRELRGALHGGAVLSEGLAPVEAVMVRTPYMSGLFGWSDPLPDPEPLKAAWDRAEEATNRAMARRLSALDDAERQQLVELSQAAQGD
jgi:hypothetical protein